MFSKNKYLKIISEKPDIFGNIPELILPKEKAEELSRIPLLAIGEVSGMHNIEGIIHALSIKRPDAFLPTISYTGTEYGSWDVINKALKSMRKIIEKELRIYFAEPVLLGSPDFWWALNGYYANFIRNRFGFFSYCYGCRLYSFALRVPLSRIINADILIPADFGTQDSFDKIYNSTAAISYYQTLISGFGLDLAYSTIREKVPEDIDYDDGSKMQCIIEDNNLETDASNREPSGLSAFFENYALPAVAKILSVTLSGVRADYLYEVDGILSQLKKQKNIKNSKSLKKKRNT